MKKCTKCKIEKELSEFNKDKRNKSGLSNICKCCKSEEAKKYYSKNKKIVCEKVKKYRLNNFDAVNSRVKKYYENNREDLIQYKKGYYENNKPKLIKLSKIYIKNKRKSNPLFRFKERISRLIRDSINNNGYVKTSNTQSILGCTYLEFRSYLESKFVDGMSWENCSEWHIDHIRPISWAKDEEEIIRLNHYTNLQPLWAKDNILKGNRWEG